MFKFKFIERIFEESLYIYVANKQLNRYVVFDLDGGHLSRHMRGAGGASVVCILLAASRSAFGTVSRLSLIHI